MQKGLKDSKKLQRLKKVRKLFFIDQFKQTEIAKMLGVSTLTVKRDCKYLKQNNMQIIDT